MADAEKWAEDLKQLRDEIRLKLHLASKDLQDEWDELEDKWNRFEAEANLSQSAEDIGEALSKLGEELTNAYKRIRDAL